MKKNVLLALLSIALCSNTDLIAQVGKPWLIGGNNLTGNRGIGSNNNFALGFRTNGIERARITADGLFGINTSTFNEPYRLKVSHTDFGLDIENHASSDDWELFTASPPGNLQLYFNTNFRGSFDLTTGVYSAISDERLKKNIKPMSTMLEKIDQLKPSIYQFKNGDAKEYSGFIAQDVMKVFPNLVTHHVVKERNLDVYTLDYSGFGVIAIKGIQELQQTIQKQEQTITTLQEQIAELKAAVSAISNNLSTSARDFRGISLQQNQPNPFSQNTIIRYTIPQGSDAQIKIYDVSGNIVKSVKAADNGQVQISAFDLKPGSYIYNLIVNGAIAASKKMVILK